MFKIMRARRAVLEGRAWECCVVDIRLFGRTLATYRYVGIGLTTCFWMLDSGKAVLGTDLYPYQKRAMLLKRAAKKADVSLGTTAIRMEGESAADYSKRQFGI